MPAVRPGLMKKYKWSSEDEARKNITVYTDNHGEAMVRVFGNFGRTVLTADARLVESHELRTMEADLPQMRAMLNATW